MEELQEGKNGGKKDSQNPPPPPKQNHKATMLGGQTLDEQSGRRLIADLIQIHSIYCSHNLCSPPQLQDGVSLKIFQIFATVSPQVGSLGITADVLGYQAHADIFL